MRIWIALAFVVMLSGCFEPFRAHVPDEFWLHDDVVWSEERHGLDDGGWFGTSTFETEYRFSPEETPPFSGIIQVFAKRGGSDGRDAMFASAKEAVLEAAADQAIELRDAPSEGTRTLRSEIPTSWALWDGLVTGDGELFRADAEVVILVEAGYDGASRTGFSSIVMVQVSEEVDIEACSGTLLPNCDTTLRRIEDSRTLHSIVGDAAGTFGHTSENGMLWNLVTHG